MKQMNGALHAHWNEYLNLFVMFDRIGVPKDSRWRSLLLYLREIKDYNHLTDIQKADVQGLLTNALKANAYSDERLDTILKEYHGIVVKPYKVKVVTLVREASDVIREFRKILRFRYDDVDSLEEESIAVISSGDMESLDVVIKKLRAAFARVKNILEEDIRKLEQMATRDGLTNIANRRGFELFMEDSITKWIAEKRPMSLALFDIDDFKRFNDDHGHRIGDQVLVVVATRLKKALREFGKDNDVLAARYGGEEFALIVSGPDAGNLACVTEKCRNHIKKFNFLIRDADGNVVESGFHITVSAGVVSLCEKWEGAYMENMIDSADKALFFAKQSGKDRAFEFKPESERGLEPITL